MPLARALFTLQSQAVYELYEHNKAKAAVAATSFYMIFFLGFFPSPHPHPLNFYDPDIKPWEIRVYSRALTPVNARA